MYSKTFTVLFLSALAMAAPDKVRRQNASDLSALASVAGVTSIPTDPAALSSLAALESGLSSDVPPGSILSVLETAIPSSLISQLTNAAAVSSFASEFNAGSTPAWYSQLPSNVQAFFSTYSPGLGVSSALSALTSDVSSLNSAAGSTTSSAGSAATTTAVTTTAATNRGSTAANNAASTSSSKAGSPKQTAALAFGFGGVVGVLGLAAAL